MAKTLFQHEIVESDMPCLAVRSLPDGRVTLYYDGDEIPELPVAPEILPRILSVQEFRGRFSDAELAAIVLSADVAVKVLMVKLQTRADVDLADPQIAAGLDLLVARNLLTPERRTIIGT